MHERLARFFEWSRFGRTLRAVLRPSNAAVASPRPSMAAAAWIDLWMRERAPERSHYQYAVYARRWSEVLGSTPLTGLTADHLRQELRRLRSQRSSATATHYFQWVVLVLGDAVRDGLIERNPADSLRRSELPRAVSRPRGYFSGDEVTTILTHSTSTTRALYTCAFLTGARFGEIAALRWSDIVDASPLTKLRIVKSWSDRRKKTDQTKTNIDREIPVHPTLATLLAGWREVGFRSVHGEEPASDGLIFMQRKRNGKLGPLNPGSVRDGFYADLDRLGIRRRVFHATCGTFVTLARNAGAREDVVRFLRHPSPTDAHSLYMHYPWESLCAEIGKLPISVDAAFRFHLVK